MSLGGGPPWSGGGGSRSGDCRSNGPTSAEAGLATAPPAHVTRKATRNSREQAIERPTLNRTHGYANCFGGSRRPGCRRPRARSAEREGFEPSNEVAPVTRLAGECLQPLGHLSRRL